MTDLRAILFDLDGTLLDSFQSHLEIYQATLARFGIALTAAEFRRLYTPNWNELYRAVGLPPEHWDAASNLWLREAAAHQPRPFPEVVATLGRLRERFRLGLVTAGSRVRVGADLERGGMAECFEVVVTADDVRQPKPAPEGLLTALRALGIAADQALYVGDTDPDYEFARAAGVAFLGVTNGFSRLPERDDEYTRLAAVTDLPTFLQI
jgi:HAD superfamily hydrolase (TIGR01509 family)